MPETANARGTRGRLALAFGGLFAGGLAGKALGFLRELALAASFGTSAEVGAFRASQTATTIPAFFFTKNALNSGFIPLCTRYVNEDPERASALFWSVMVTMTVVSLAITAALFLAAGPIAAFLVPGFGPEAQSTTAAMIRVMAIGAPFLIQGSLLSYLEMAHGTYVVESLRGIVQNVGLFAGIGAAVVIEDPIYLAWGFNAYLVLYHLVGVHRVVRSGIVSRPTHWAWSETRSVLSEFLQLIKPLLVLPLALQAAFAVERIVASLISEGTVAALDYARTVSETGLVLVAVPLGLIGLAELGRVTRQTALDRLQTALPPLLIVLIPISAVLAVQAESVVEILFKRGEFDTASVEMTAAILMGLAIGFWAHVIGYVLLKALSAQLQNRRALVVTAVAAVAHIVFNVTLYRHLGPLALGLGGSVFGLVSFALAAWALDLVGVTVRTLWPLLIGVAVYVPLGLAMEVQSLWQFTYSTGAGLLFWAAFALVVPGLRRGIMNARDLRTQTLEAS